MSKDLNSQVESVLSLLARLHRDPKILSDPYSASALLDGWFHNLHTVTRKILLTKEIPDSRSKKALEVLLADSEVKRAPRDRSKRAIAFMDRFSLILKGEGIKLISRSRVWPDRGEGSSEMAVQVGKFTVRATDPAYSDTAAKIIKNVSGLIQKSKVRKVRSALYGDVDFVDHVAHGKKNTAALYWIEKDLIQVVMAKRFSSTALKSLIHEIGHRYYRKIMDAQAKEAWVKHHKSLADGKTESPRKGDVLREGADTITVLDDRVVFPSGVMGYKVEVVGKSGKTKEGYITYNQMIKLKSKLKFPTPYSATDNEEHFCEAFSLYCTGELSADHTAVFEDLFC